MAKYGTFKYGTKRYGTDSPYITDRTEDDLKNKTYKAFINVDDMNRIEAEALILRLHNSGYCSILHTERWEPVPCDKIPIDSDLERIRSNIQRMRSGCFVYANTPEVPDSLKIMDIYKMNDIERILQDLHYQIGYIEKNKRVCGAYICGGG